MIPCLYAEAETAFTSNGIGKLCDTISCRVTEKRNGSYELKLTYPSDGLHAEELCEGAIILAKPSERAQPQPFRIYKTNTPLTGELEVAARHIQYQENFITVSPFSATGSQSAMAQLKQQATTDCPFSFWTDIDSQAVFTISTPASIRSCLGGMDGSMLDTYGGEYEWDFLTARLHRSRGRDYGVRIVYGKNLVDFQMEKSVENVITGVHPYWKNSEGGELVELPEKVVRSAAKSLAYEKVTPLDCSSQFQEKPTEEQLRSYAVNYLKSTSLTEPDLDIKIDFLQLWQTPGYADIAAAERVGLCDTVHVYISKLGIEVSCKVTETEYDVLLERYSSITLSNASVYSRNSSLSGALGSIRDEAQTATEAVGRVESQVTDVRILSAQQEYFSILAAGLFGLHYSTGMTEDGGSARYAHTSEKLSESAFAWMGSEQGFFLSKDGGKSWTHGFNTEGAVKLAAEAVGLSADALISGVLKTSLVKILGTENFAWEGDAITLTDPEDSNRLIKIGQYSEGSYGIAVSGDSGETWEAAVDFDGVAGDGETTIVQGETIPKSVVAPTEPEINDLWVDTGNRRLKLWNGEEWVVIGYEPEDTEPTEPDEPTDPDNTDTDNTNPDESTEPTDPDNSGETDNTEGSDNTEDTVTEEGGTQDGE